MKFKSIIPLVVVLAVLGVVFAFVNQPEETVVDDEEERYYVWEFEMEELQRIEITLPDYGMSQAWIMLEDQYYYFDEEIPSKVDMTRWGGGVPLILSGPGAERLLYESASDDKLEELGFDSPLLTIELTLTDSSVYNIEVGDTTPSDDYYIRLSDSRAIYTVDPSWVEVVGNLVVDPPYQPADIIVTGIDVSPSEVSAGQTVTITAVVTNNGVESGTSDIELKIDGVVQQTQTVELDRAESASIIFTTNQETAGVHSVNVSGATGKFTVK